MTGDRTPLRERLAQALTAERWGSKHQLGEHGHGHRYYAPCGICQGDVDAIVGLVLPVVEAETAALREQVDVLTAALEHARHLTETAERHRDQAENRAALFREQVRTEHDRAEQAERERDVAVAAADPFKIERVKSLTTAMTRLVTTERDAARKRAEQAEAAAEPKEIP